MRPHAPSIGDQLSAPIYGANASIDRDGSIFDDVDKFQSTGSGFESNDVSGPITPLATMGSSQYHSGNVFSPTGDDKDTPRSSKLKSSFASFGSRKKKRKNKKRVHRKFRREDSSEESDIDSDEESILTNDSHVTVMPSDEPKKGAGYLNQFVCECEPTNRFY